MSDTPKPLPCPFCGEEPVVEPWYRFNWHSIVCRSCITELSKPTKAEAIAAWNRRAPVRPS